VAVPEFPLRAEGVAISQHGVGATGQRSVAVPEFNGRFPLLGSIPLSAPLLDPCVRGHYSEWEPPSPWPSPSRERGYKVQGDCRVTVIDHHLRCAPI
jgi:hypothetical protein